jgi:hypothetical protein
MRSACRYRIVTVTREAAKREAPASAARSLLANGSLWYTPAHRGS